jgi:hypothetical protein
VQGDPKRTKINGIPTNEGVNTMKRSEMLEIITKILNANLTTPNYPGHAVMANQILKQVETAGMLPPPKTHIKHHQIDQVVPYGCGWEAEDETK